MNDNLEVTPLDEEFFSLVIDWLVENEIYPSKSLNLLGACIGSIALSTDCPDRVFATYLDRLHDSFRKYKKRTVDADKPETE